MQILVPISAYFGTAPHFQAQLTPLSQMIAAHKQPVRLDETNINLLRFKQDKKGRKKPVRLMPIPLGQILTEIERLPNTQDTLLLVPSHNFDAAPYNNMVQSVLYRHPGLQTCTLNCYGSALSYMVQGLVSFCNHHEPSAPQLALFADKLNELVQTYVVCPHSPIFEPTIHPVIGWTASLLRRNRIYRSDMPTWEPTQVRAIGQRLQEGSLAECKVWIDSHDGSSHARWVAKQFNRWGLPEELLVINKLHHTSRSFPRRFALVTITPNKKKVKQLAGWALRWEG